MTTTTKTTTTTTIATTTVTTTATQVQGDANSYANFGYPPFIHIL